MSPGRAPRNEPPRAPEPEHPDRVSQPPGGHGPAPTPARSPGLFGARKALRDAEGENTAQAQRIIELEAALAAARRSAAGEIRALRDQVATLDRQVATLRNRDAAAYEEETARAEQRLGEVRATLASATDAVRAEHVRARETADEGRTRLARAVEEADRILTAATEKAAEREQAVESGLASRRARIAELDNEIVTTEDLAMLQQVGIYEYRHRLEDAVAYKARLAELKDQFKTMARNDEAVLTANGWTVNGSAAEGKRMLKDYTKLMLRAYNAEADNCVRTMRPHRLASSIDRLDKSREIIAKLGRTMQIRVSEPYHRARIEELELTADHLARQEEEKERIRAERERNRDEEQARREFERAKARLTKEQDHWARVQQQWLDKGDDAKVAEAEAKLEEIGAAIAGVEAREANIRTGHVYVISNVGAFGESMVKIGMTRREDPRDRVRELGDASVPFRFDVHAIVFSEDAVTLENRLHRELADRRVNRINLRREFFHATPAEVLEALDRVQGRDNVLEYVEIPEAEEWRASLAIASRETVSTG